MGLTIVDVFSASIAHLFRSAHHPCMHSGNIQVATLGALEQEDDREVPDEVRRRLTWNSFESI